MDFRHLRYFVVVAEELSFTRAARRLNTVQPSLSQQIKKLEEEVGTLLFLRKNQHLELTGPGRVLLEEAYQILDRSNTAVEKARLAAGVDGGQFSVGLLPSNSRNDIGLVFQEMLARYPHLQLQLHVLDPEGHALRVKRRSLDMAFLTEPVDDEDLAQQLCFKSRLVVALPAGHPLTAKASIPPKDLAAVPLMLPSEQKLRFPFDSCRRIAAQAGVRFTPGLEADCFPNLLEGVERGLGFTFVPESILVPPGIVTRPLDLDPHPSVSLYLCYRKENPNPALELCLRLMEAHFGRDAMKNH